MSGARAHEIHASISEDEVARRWWTLPPGSILPLSDGMTYQLVFVGRLGGSRGPDALDAVLDTGNGARLAGDIEFHVRASEWTAHGHEADPRYNNVILHVVLLCDDPTPTRRQDGSIVPLCSLYDLAMLPALSLPGPPEQPWEIWPCANVMSRLSESECGEMLRQAGLWRFEQKAHAFVEQLHAGDSTNACEPGAGYDYDLCLLPALAEGLGYGRDRAFFRAIGLRLVGLRPAVPEPLGRSPRPEPLDVARLRVLRRLVIEWQPVGIWRTLYALLASSPRGSAALEQALEALRSAFYRLGCSPARSDILICNVVLPFAAAVALLEHDDALGRLAQKLYELHHGLPPNRVTRMMTAQLRLSEEPRGNCRQQGLHYIYQQTCREKRCELCIAGKRDI
jgi:hypothetical protein